MELIQRCNICGNNLTREYLKRLYQCEVCGLISAKMNINEKELVELYQEKYFFGDEYFNYLSDRKALEFNFLKRIKKINKLLPLDKNKKVIEVGCAYGFFLDLLKDRVGKSIGYDITQKGVDYARKNFIVDARCENFLNSNEKDCDLVCMWDVIEHLDDPSSFVLKAWEVLKSGGVLAFTTGDMGSIIARIRGEKWRMIHPPTHLYYFDKKSIKKLLSKNGFKLVSFSHPRVYRNVGSMLNQIIEIRKKQNEKSIFFDVVYKIFKKINLDKVNFPLNFFDIMEVVAIKK